jgi:hypothetical protein
MSTPSYLGTAAAWDMCGGAGVSAFLPSLDSRTGQLEIDMAWRTAVTLCR